MKAARRITGVRCEVPGIRDEGSLQDLKPETRHPTPTLQPAKDSPSPPRDGPGVADRVVDAGRRNHGRKCSRLKGRKIRSRFSKVAAGRRLDSIGPWAEFHDVQVKLQNALLRKSLLDPPRDRPFAELAPGCAGLRKVQVLGQLLGDGRGAEAQPLSFPVLLQSDVDRWSSGTSSPGQKHPEASQRRVHRRRRPRRG